MLYLGIDQHARQITISLRDENGDVLQARQVSTQPEKINAFFQQLTRECLHVNESFIAILEVCGFNIGSSRIRLSWRPIPSATSTPIVFTSPLNTSAIHFCCTNLLTFWATRAYASSPKATR